MTDDTIIKLAREADPWGEHGKLFDMASVTPETLKRFAELVVAEERNRAINICRDRAAKIESEAQRAIDNGEHDEVSALRSTAWQLTVAANEIKADTE